MNTDTKISSITSYTFLIALLYFLSIPLSHAHSSGYQDHMGMGQMGMGHMGMGHMGMDHMSMGHMGMGLRGMKDRIYHMLDLSSAQRKQLRDINKSMRPQHWALKDQMAEYRDQLYDLYSKEKPDAKAIGAVYKKIFDIQRQMIELRIQANNQKYDVLTKKQREKLKEWRSNWRGDNTERGRGMHRMMHE